MFKRLLSYVLALGVAATAVYVPVTVSAEFKEIDEAVYDSYPQEFTPLDISELANMSFVDDVADDSVGGWTDQGETNDMRNFDKFGEQYFSGVKFNIIDPQKNNGKAVITLRGQNKTDIINKAEIPVGKKGAGIYFLHASAYVQTNIATYTLVYEDGSTYEQPIRNNIENFNFWGASSSDVAWAAWTGSNKSTTSASIYMYVMTNPYPEKTIEKIVCETEGSGAFDIIVAATLTDSGPYKMIEKDIGNVDTSDWMTYEGYQTGSNRGTVMDLTRYVTAGAPSGKHGYLKADGDKFVFEDGTEANFWGTDTSATEMFRSKEEINLRLEEIASWGFNLVRLHKYDQPNNGQYNIYTKDSGDDHFAPKQVDSLCYMIAKMKELGMYLLLDLKVTNTWNEDINIRNDVTDASTMWLGYEDGTMRDIHFLRELLGTYNPYTGMTIAEDPTVCMIDFKNENTGTSVKKSDVSGISDEVRGRFNKWLREKYGTTEELKKAWTFNGTELLKDDENLENGTVELQYSGERSGAQKPRSSDSLNFIADSMINYSKTINEELDKVGYKGLVTPTTLWGADLTTLLYVLTREESDFVDSHDYWSHPGGENSLHGNTHIGWNKPVSMLETNSFGYMGRLFNQSVYGLPHTITEWDECDLNPTMSEGFTLMSVFASYQNWTAFNFTAAMADFPSTMILSSTGERVNLKNNFWKGDPSVIEAYWTYSNNPIKMASGPAAALMKLRGDVSPAKSGFYHRMSQNDYFNAQNTDLPHNAHLGLSGKTGLSYDSKEYDPDYNDNDILYRGYMAQKLGIPYVSDTGEFRTDLNNATFELNTEMSQAVIGRLDGKKFETDDMIVEVVDNPFATVNLTSLDDEPIWKSGSLLISTVGDQRGTGEVRSRDGMSLVHGGQFPMRVEQITGSLTLKTTDDITVYTLDQAGRRQGTAIVNRDKNGWAVIDMNVDNACTNYEVVKNSSVLERKANTHIEYPQIEVKDLFTDFAGYEWAKDKITRNVLWGTMKGVSETEFKPGNAITRGDLASAVVNATKLSASTKEMFPDVDESDVNYIAIKTLKASGVVSGDENGCFNPNEPVSRQDALTIIWRAMEKGNVRHSKKSGNELNKFKDNANIKDYAKSGVENMMAQKYVSELFNDINFDTDKPLTRVEAANIVYGILWD